MLWRGVEGKGRAEREDVVVQRKLGGRWWGGRMEGRRKWGENDSHSKRCNLGYVRRRREHASTTLACIKESSIHEHGHPLWVSARGE